MSVIPDPIGELMDQIAHTPLSQEQSELIITALGTFRMVAEEVRDQWGDDYLWEKWGLTGIMISAEGNIDRALKGVPQ